LYSSYIIYILKIISLTQKIKTKNNGWRTKNYWKSLGEMLTKPITNIKNTKKQLEAK